MKVLIYGAGSVGLGLASCLIKSGEEVALIGREETVQALRQEGFWRTGIFGNYKAAAEDFICFTSLQDLPNEDYDYVLVCTKTFDTEIAARDISSCRFLQKGHGQVVLCQNGWGNAEIFSTFFPRDRVKNARVITGFIRLQRNQVDITVHADAIHIGNLFGPDISGLGPLARAIDRGGIPSRVTGEICKDLWAKMLYNCNLNALGTLLDVPYGVLGESEETRSIMGEVVAEVFQVMAPAGHSTHWRSPEDYMETFTPNCFQQPMRTNLLCCRIYAGKDALKSTLSTGPWLGWESNGRSMSHIISCFAVW